MFEIGSTLQEARTRQGLELRDAAEATRIRVKFLAALEGERFGELPAEVYARGFLRTYADFLGLDGELYVAELNARIEASRPPPPPPPPDPRFTLPSLDRRAWGLLGAGAVVVLVALVGWHRGGGSPGRTPSAAKKQVAAVSNSIADRPTVTRRAGGTRIGHLMLVASRGDCWLSVHEGSRAGRVLYEGLLRTGDSLPVAGKRLWIRIGAPWNLEARLNGRPLRDLPVDTGNVFVTPAGLTPAW
jgi:Helix-turn-helix domain/RodZ C-terminal domain